MTYMPLLPISRARRLVWTLNGAFNDKWREFDALLNPKHDPIIASLYQALHNIKLTLNMLPPNNVRTYWIHLDQEDQLYAEAIAPVLYFRAQELMALIRERKMEYIEDHLDLELPLPNPDDWAKRIADDIKHRKNERLVLSSAAANRGSNYIHIDDVPEMALRFDAVTAFLPPSWPGHSKWNRGVAYLNEYYGDLFSAGTGASESLREWRTCGARSQVSLYESWLLFSNEMYDARAQHNALNAQAAKTRTLLINGAIPLPNLSTIMAWYSICGLETTQLMDMTYVCFTHPHMPVTTEHGRGMTAQAMQDESSNSSHSLPARSGGHVRTKEGRIIHGRHEMWGIVFNDVEKIHDMAIWVYDSLMTRPAAAMRQAFPRIKRSDDSDFWGVGAYRISTLLSDPWVASESTLMGDWHRDYPISTTFRALAKTTNHHFMFTDDTEGMIALEVWKDAFLYAFKEYMMIREGLMPKFNLSSEIVLTNERRTPEEALYVYNSLLSIQFNDCMRSKYTVRTSKGKRLAFDFGDLSLPE